MSNPNPNFNSFPNPQSLSDWLKPRLNSDSFASWGVKPGTKNVHNLWLELFEGETSLADSTPPIRTLEVMIVRIIGQNEKFLVEWKQEMSDGSVRFRSRQLSEKMKPGEAIESAVIRAVKEELGSVIGDCLHNDTEHGVVKILPNSYTKKVEESDSLSYPGFPACYVLHSVDAVVEGLPQEDFVTEEEGYKNYDESSGAGKAISVKKHCWKWVQGDPV
ncbi:hypothetical protein RJ641_007814 [Dillenia turbinata]|uniref:Nudix hydrolase domain-containing protein n=1 Tax=Dillenia turbinata TaxID=194707 RepID=A0AAN8V1Y3_9MAGN